MASSLSLPKPATLAQIAAGLGTFITVINTYGVIRPDVTLSLLSFPPAETPKDKKLTEAITRMFAATRIVVGLTGITNWWYGVSYRVMGVQVVLGSVMAIVDGLVTKQLIGEGEWSHWGAIPVSLAVGSMLIASSS